MLWGICLFQFSFQSIPILISIMIPITNQTPPQLHIPASDLSFFLSYMLKIWIQHIYLYQYTVTTSLPPESAIWNSLKLICLYYYKKIMVKCPQIFQLHSVGKSCLSLNLPWSTLAYDKDTDVIINAHALFLSLFSMLRQSVEEKKNEKKR